MKKLTAAQQKVIDSIKASAAKFAGKTYEEAYPRVEDRDRWTKRVYENAQKGRYLVEAHPNTISALVKAGIIDREGNSLFYWLVEDKKEEETMNTTNTITYHGKQVPIYGGAWNDSMNSCFYDVIGSVKGYDICRSTADETIFALSNPMAEDEKEEEIMTATTANIGDKVKIGATTYTIAEIFYAELFHSRFPSPDDGWMIEFKDTNGGYHYWKQYLDGGEFIPAAEDTTTTNNNKEEETMKTTFTLINGITYTMNPQTNRYSKSAKGKTVRIGKDEYEEAKRTYHYESIKFSTEDEQAELDKEPCFVDPVADLYTPAVLGPLGTVNCDECNCTECVHRDRMARNPKNVGGEGACPRLDVKPQQEEPDEVQDPELEEIMDETGLEASDAELERNIRKEKKAKKAAKPRRSKDVAFEMDFGTSKVTLTAKQVDFLRELRKTDLFNMDGDMVVEDITITIRGQFEDKPMTVGAMISTLCEKRLGTRVKAKVGNRTMTVFGLTNSGKDITNAIK